MALLSTHLGCPINPVHFKINFNEILPIWITGIVQLIKRSGSGKSNIIDVGNIRHLITKSIDRDSNNISYDDSPLELLNKSLHVCTIVKRITGSSSTMLNYKCENHTNN